MEYKEFSEWLLNNGFKKLEDGDFIQYQDINEMNASIGYLIKNIDGDIMCSLFVYIVKPGGSELLLYKDGCADDVINLLKSFIKIGD